MNKRFLKQGLKIKNSLKAEEKKIKSKCILIHVILPNLLYKMRGDRVGI